MFVALKNVRMFVFLNNLVMIIASFPMYVKVAYFCLFSMVCSVLYGWVCFLFCLYVGSLLLCSIFPMFCNLWFLFLSVICVHAVEEVIDCGVLMFLWVTGVVVYDHICRCWFSKYVECQCVV
jgi:hypothetical protein